MLSCGAKAASSGAPGLSSAACAVMPVNLILRRGGGAEGFVVILTLTYPVNPLYGSERTVCTLINVQTRKECRRRLPRLAPGGPAVRVNRGDAFSRLGRAARPYPGGPPSAFRVEEVKSRECRHPDRDRRPDSPAGYSGARAAAASRRSASSAYSVAPSGSTASVKAAAAEWLEGAVCGSVPGGQAPSRTNAPGTSLSTYEKSSEPASGSGGVTARSAPNKPAAVAVANAASAGSLTVTG